MIAFDRRVEELERRRDDVVARAQALREQLQAVETADREALEAWVVAGTGERPSPTLPAIEDEPLIRVADYRALLEESTFRGDRVRPT